MIRSRSRFHLVLPFLVTVQSDLGWGENRGPWMFISICHQVHRGKMGLALGLLWFVLFYIPPPPFNVLLI